MDDVDRLFECFKCGISPPPSALRERKRIKRQPIQRSKAQEVDSPRSPEQIKKISSDLQLSAEKLVQGGSTTVEAKSFNRRKQLSPVVFYGSPHGVPPKQPSRLLLRVLREIRVDLTAQKRLSSSLFRKEVWATFPRQEEAMQFAKRHENVHVFSYQDHFSGQRRFLVSSYNEFWRRYKIMESKFRHHYEVIQEGLPCHLYFDLEFNKKDNGNRNGDEMVDLLISVVFEALLEKYSIQGNMEWILELDSSTEAKFSRHLIIRIQKTAFKDNSHVGAFVTEMMTYYQICSRISSAKGRDGRFENLFIRKDSSSADFSHLFVDTAVYTRNRCFRLALSSKAGKNSVLLPTGRFKAKDMMSEEEMFMASLICNLEVDCEKLLVCKSDLDCIKTLHFDTEVNPSFGKSYSWPQEFALNGCTSDASATYFLGKSPFPALDAFVEFVATIGNVSGKIRSWYWFSEFGLMVYSMSRNRYCERIGRQHKSNHVIYIADLRKGVYYQKCHDPDCRGYRSPSRPIPWNIVPDMVYECQKDHERVFFDDENTASSGVTDSWWLEAIRVADEVENKQNSLELSNPEYMDPKYDDWWTSAASQVALTH
ncbi:DNA-directed primase/polymerase protein isoform X6 [Rosa chinensis]|uniref:DNA-directed primase/polymerase protein isoform X6 n=1 Tax=Rosa chinensis TaxID=74649 RepID=UPI001AD8C098|nr:DNA-directed primase/polymerase protein isoform X6 [Rosa chinensis]